MSDIPKRIQLRRTKGWRMPPNTVKVCRPGPWGNPFTVAEYGHSLAVFNYKIRLRGLMEIGALNPALLRGKNLACWCSLDQPCHADILLEIANLREDTCRGCDGDGYRMVIDPDEQMAVRETCGKCGGRSGDATAKERKP
jgi:hypothetical protein